MRKQSLKLYMKKKQMQFHQLHMHFTKCSYNAPLLITKAFGYILNTVSLNTVISNC